jgi:hypothetical protein
MYFFFQMWIDSRDTNDQKIQNETIRTSPLSFYISTEWKHNSSANKNPEFILNNEKDLFLTKKRNNSRSLTIDFNTSLNDNNNLKTGRDLNQILKDIQTYRDQLYNLNGSIHIQIYPTQSKGCYCKDNQSSEICKQISEFEKEICQNDFVEYIYKIESVTNNNTYS